MHVPALPAQLDLVPQVGSGTAAVFHIERFQGPGKCTVRISIIVTSITVGVVFIIAAVVVVITIT